VVLVMGRTEVWLEKAAVVLMVAICLAITYVAMIVSERLVRRLGQTGSDVVGRISSVLLAGLAVQFIRRSATGGAVCAGLRSAQGRVGFLSLQEIRTMGFRDLGCICCEAALARRP
jgi:hypothetical protein